MWDWKRTFDMSCSNFYLAYRIPSAGFLMGPWILPVTEGSPPPKQLFHSSISWAKIHHPETSNTDLGSAPSMAWVLWSCSNSPLHLWRRCYWDRNKEWHPGRCLWMALGLTLGLPEKLVTDRPGPRTDLWLFLTSGYSWQFGSWLASWNPILLWVSNSTSASTGSILASLGLILPCSVATEAPDHSLLQSGAGFSAIWWQGFLWLIHASVWIWRLTFWIDIGTPRHMTWWVES